MSRLAKMVINLFLAIFLSASTFLNPSLQIEDPDPPETPVRLIFIHHSTGENWLNDDNGGLARELQANNYFPSDTNYGWGPDGIGDRTDIPNWVEWFRGPNSEAIMRAVFNETEVNSPYSRTLTNPGGENQIVMFKSCFPNSDMQGSPDDPAAPGSDISVSNAKYTYNQILQYFATRPDKLFIVVTAPPLTDGTNAANARAFNQWLVNDWLRENNYSLPNVAVFDFYNVLTGPNNHHRFANGTIEHSINDNRNTEYYPSDDDHPSRQGNQKATQEFLPLLNVFYNRWQAGNPQPIQQPPPVSEPMVESEPAARPASDAVNGGLLFDFESGEPIWEGSADEAVASTIRCEADSSAASTGVQSLQIEFNVLAESWTTCSYFFDAPRDLSASEGVQLMLQVQQPGKILHMDIFTGADGERATYSKDIQYPPAGEIWTPVQIRWGEFVRVEWETDGGSIFSKPEQITGMAFGFPAGDETNSGLVRVDAIQTISNGDTPSQPEVAEPERVEEQSDSGPDITQEELPAQPEKKSGGILPFCGSIALLPLGVMVSGGLRKKRKNL